MARATTLMYPEAGLPSWAQARAPTRAGRNSGAIPKK